MLDVIDTLVGSLLGINPIKYIFSRAYRVDQIARRGREARYIFRFQVTVAVVVLVLALVLILGHG